MSTIRERTARSSSVHGSRCPENRSGRDPGGRGSRRAARRSTLPTFSQRPLQIQRGISDIFIFGVAAGGGINAV
ncbi:MAG: hypothetical protein DMG06_22025 [Acidobacteria bacterium]|nr:MAG: hypothetical protein DMG06_22025 [Acidobacteriota bacterium]